MISWSDLPHAGHRERRQHLAQRSSDGVDEEVIEGMRLLPAHEYTE
jgi:hypothetical protein